MLIRATLNRCVAEIFPLSWVGGRRRAKVPGSQLEELGGGAKADQGVVSKNLAFSRVSVCVFNTCDWLITIWAGLPYIRLVSSPAAPS